MRVEEKRYPAIQLIEMNQKALIEQRREERMEILQQMTDLERERAKKTNNLKRKTRQTVSRFNFLDIEETYAHVRNLISRLILKVDNWMELLETYEQ